MTIRALRWTILAIRLYFTAAVLLGRNAEAGLEIPAKDIRRSKTAAVGDLSHRNPVVPQQQSGGQFQPPPGHISGQRFTHLLPEHSDKMVCGHAGPPGQRTDR